MKQPIVFSVMPGCDSPSRFKQIWISALNSFAPIIRPYFLQISLQIPAVMLKYIYIDIYKDFISLKENTYERFHKLGGR